MKLKQAGRGVTLLALAAALGAAVYLNWSFSRNVPDTVTVDTGDAAAVSAGAEEQEEAQPVQAEESDTAVPVYDPLTTETDAQTDDQAADKNYGEAQLVSVSEDTGTEFFDSARLTREKKRDEALDAIENTLKDASLSDEEKQKTSQALQTEISNIEQEANLETLIRAKGFVDCVVMLSADSANVTVMTESDALTAEEVTRIRDVILSGCPEIKAQNITVVEVK
ncbi:SpoIIIAH-like family protein [uncultured Gemmiger sp.]|uniref:SpoIIIAH-like family protein n=1 Tax=uncultured Gemmiger sp. TaxID=1623490 RepID=UPI0026015304|nr:SpoIIIAH-like family protein [uncultured Gemmiger sp.]